MIKAAQKRVKLSHVRGDCPARQKLDRLPHVLALKGHAFYCKAKNHMRV